MPGRFRLNHVGRKSAIGHEESVRPGPGSWRGSFLDSPEDIAAVYRRRLDERNRALERWTTRDRRVADLRLAAFLVLVVLGILIARGTAISLWWLAVPAVLFRGVAAWCTSRSGGPATGRGGPFSSIRTAWHGSTADGRARVPQGLSYLDDEHPYAADLDIFGSGSLFERLCTARTRSGEERWPRGCWHRPSPETIADRHDAVRELRPQLDLREDLELWASRFARASTRQRSADWGTADRAFPGSWRPDRRDRSRRARNRGRGRLVLD